MQITKAKADISLVFTHARASSKNIFDHAFQYKIMTQILPTNQYLARYKIRDTNICDRCHTSVHTILHCLWQCQLVVPYVAKILDFLTEKCNLQENIGCAQFMCGVKNNAALNHILIELKKDCFTIGTVRLVWKGFLKNLKQKFEKK